MIDNPKNCYGCGACVQTCPTKCITMEYDKYGFSVPNVDALKCTSCNKCESVCPIGKIETPFYEQKAFAAVNKDKKQLLSESSGGVFGAVATKILEQGGIVYGCSMQKTKAKHIRITKLCELPLLFGSKYVQSNIGKSFIEAKHDLDKGKDVLFSGTPCQVAGLKLFLGKKYNNLITIDIVCHGVSSSYHFEKFISGLSEKNNVLISDIKFRTKKAHFVKGTYSGEIIGKKLDNSQPFKMRFDYFNHYYYFYFLEGSIFRECCYQCEFACLNRQGDLTLGDLWGAEGFNLPFSIKNGCSLVLVNSSKGANILGLADLQIQEIPLKAAVSQNMQLCAPVNKPLHRDKLIAELKVKSANQLQLDFKRRYCFQRIKGKLKYVLPNPVKRLLLRFRYRNINKYK